ncbi:MAG: hypothetical protein LBT59_14795 [Clostridiales bacterium]|jgi:ethanolamine utilization cobalamin adenosyltransferase|nr:hypothetical protein [Clostridiales bacterium]
MPNSILKAEDIQKAIAATTNYQAACDEIYKNLTQCITDLTNPGANFNGDSSVGFNALFEESIKPRLDTELKTLTDGLKKMLGDIEKTLLEQVDPDLGTSNRNAGGLPIATKA